MNARRELKTDRDDCTPPGGIVAGWSDVRRGRRRTREVMIDPERVRRYTTQEVRWDAGIERLTIEDVHLDVCLDVAARIMEVLPYDRIELEADDRDVLRYKVSDPEWSLRSIVFLKKSLRRLAADPDRSIKIEYLQRDLRWSTTGRRSFVYPSALRHVLM